jgi:hypothetical protein
VRGAWWDRSQESGVRSQERGARSERPTPPAEGERQTRRTPEPRNPSEPLNRRTAEPRNRGASKPLPVVAVDEITKPAQDRALADSLASLLRSGLQHSAGQP